MAAVTALWHIVFIGIVSNLDNLGVGVAYGARRIAVPPLSNALIALVAFVFTFVANWVGAYTGQWLPDWVAKSVGAAVLIIIGIWVLVSHWRQRPVHQLPRTQPELPPSVLEVWRQPEHADRDASGAISVGESLVLGVALAVNCLTNGFVSGLWAWSATMTAVSNACFSYVSLWCGSWLGRRYAGRYVEHQATVAAGCLLILLGLGQLF